MSSQLSVTVFNQRKINLLPVIAAQQMVLFPLYFFIPFWITLLNVVICLIAYFSLVDHRFKFMAWTKHMITVLAVGGVLFSFHKLTGRDAGVALIATMYGLKLLEVKSPRDVYIILLLGFFILLSGFLFSQSPWIALYQFIPVLAILNGLVSINSLPNKNELKQNGMMDLFHPSFRASMFRLLKYLVLALPLMVVLFVFFPRLAGPIWKMPGGSSGTTGISDSMSPGAISSLQLSEEIAFRVKFDGPAPKGNQMYWRSLVLDHFDGLSWTRKKRDFEKVIIPVNQNGRLPKNARGKQHFRYEISLESTKLRWLTLLDRPVLIPKRTYLFDDYSVHVKYRIIDRIRYKAESNISLVLDKRLSDVDKGKNTQLPVGANPRLLSWAKAQRQQYTTDKAFMLAMLNNINKQEYFYTLTPPIMDFNSVDSFWFDHRRGFCEHYAGALVVLARSVGIPARVIIGYQGAEKNPLSDYWIVRSSNAHAWTEIWFEQEGWVRVDPTAAIAPHRIELQLQEDYGQRESLFEAFGFDAVDLDDIGLVKQFEYWMDQASAGWNDWILDYNQDTQRQLFKGLGIEKLSVQQVVVLMMLIVGAFLAFISLKWISTKKKLDPVQKSFVILNRKLAKYGIKISSNQGVNDLVQEIRSMQKQRPRLQRHSEIEVIKALQYYNRLRYQKTDISLKQEKDFRQQVNRLKIQAST